MVLGNISSPKPGLPGATQSPPKSKLEILIFYNKHIKSQPDVSHAKGLGLDADHRGMWCPWRIRTPRDVQAAARCKWPPSAFCTKNQPGRPVLKPFRDHVCFCLWRSCFALRIIFVASGGTPPKRGTPRLPVETGVQLSERIPPPPD
jgi:hypothetical protein